MKKRTTICLELTDSQLLHLSRLASAMVQNSEISIRDFNFPKEFRESFNSLFWEEPSLASLNESEGRVEVRLRPTELMLFVHKFHLKKTKK